VKGVPAPPFARRKRSAARGQSKSFPMEAKAHVRSKINGEGEGKERKRKREICGKTHRELDRARSCLLSLLSRLPRECPFLLTGHPIRRSWRSFLVETSGCAVLPRSGKGKGKTNDPAIFSDCGSRRESTLLTAHTILPSQTCYYYVRFSRLVRARLVMTGGKRR